MITIISKFGNQLSNLFLLAEQKLNTDTCDSIFNFFCSRYHCLALKTSGVTNCSLNFLLLRTIKMKFLAVILLSLFISVKSSTARTQDGIFHKNAKTKGENFHLKYLAHYTTILKDQSSNSEILYFRNVCSRTKRNGRENASQFFNLRWPAANCRRGRCCFLIRLLGK